MAGYRRRVSWRKTLAAVAVAALAATGCGDDAPPAAFTDIALYDFAGSPDRISHDDRPLVINFFAESCPPCVAEMPAFESVFRSVSDQVDFVGVSEDASAAAGLRIIEATGISYPTAWDADGAVLARFEALGLPTTVFVTAVGDIVDVHTGAFSEDELAARVSELLAGR
jgi:thiol-disulfide isomerase/thioredoxin